MIFQFRKELDNVKSTIKEDCFVHEFQWEVVERDQYEFRGLKVDINRTQKLMQFYAWNPRGSGLEVVDVEYSTDQLSTWNVLRKRELSSSIGSSTRSPFGFPRFSVEGNFGLKSRIDFRILLKEPHQNYSFCLVDRLHGDQLWSAATNRQFTDVEFVVGGTSYQQESARSLPKYSIRRRLNVKK